MSMIYCIQSMVYDYVSVSFVSSQFMLVLHTHLQHKKCHLMSPLHVSEDDSWFLYKTRQTSVL
jgi:hypothetical protein